MTPITMSTSIFGIPAFKEPIALLPKYQSPTMKTGVQSNSCIHGSLIHKLWSGKRCPKNNGIVKARENQNLCRKLKDLFFLFSSLTTLKPKSSIVLITSARCRLASISRVTSPVAKFTITSLCPILLSFEVIPKAQLAQFMPSTLRKMELFGLVIIFC